MIVPPRRRTASGLACLACFALGTVGGAACGGGENRAAVASRDAATAAPRAALRPVTLPDLRGADAGHQERVRTQFASLTAARDAPGTPDAALAAAYGEVGKLLLATEFFAAAEPFLLNAHALAPREMAWPYYLGHLHRLAARHDGARGFFERALAIRPDYVPALVWLGILHLDAGRPADAAPLLDKAVALQPRSAAAQWARGRAALAAGDSAAAIAHLEAALAADPDAAPVHYPLAMAYRARGDQRRAEEHLRRWKEGPVEPEDPLMDAIGASLQTVVAIEARGTRALQEGKWADAVALFRKGLEVAPGDPTLHQNLGTALFLGGDTPGALAAFEQAARLSPGYAKAHFSIGVLMDASGRDEEAIARFGEALKFDPQMTDARFSLAEALRRTGQAEAALPHYDAIVRADPGASQARFGYALALVRLGRWAAARAALEEAAAAHPDQPGLPHALARVLAAAPDDAVRDGVRALAISERLHAQFGANAALLETLAMALAETGRFADAAARQRDAMDAAARQGRSDLLPVMRQNLQRYASRLPCRIPWADNDPIHRPRAAALTK